MNTKALILLLVIALLFGCSDTEPAPAQEVKCIEVSEYKKEIAAYKELIKSTYINGWGQGYNRALLNCTEAMLGDKNNLQDYDATFRQDTTAFFKMLKDLPE